MNFFATVFFGVLLALIVFAGLMGILLRMFGRNIMDNLTASISSGIREGVKNEMGEIRRVVLDEIRKWN